jgi:hypothetical protein
MYTTTIKLKDNQRAAWIDSETGETGLLENNYKTLSEGKSRLDYEDFGIINLKMLPVLRMLLTNTEIAVVVSMIEQAEYESNSLAPLSDETSIRQLAETFKISPTIVKKTFKNLYDIGVYGRLGIQDSEYWILNPYIYWKGKFKTDSIFNHFKNATITKMVK